MYKSDVRRQKCNKPNFLAGVGVTSGLEWIWKVRCLKECGCKKIMYFTWCKGFGPIYFGGRPIHGECSSVQRVQFYAQLKTHF